MTVTTTPHLNFRGEARAALEFYQSVFGGHLMTFTNEDAGSTEIPEEAEQLTFGQVAAENGFRIMAYDVPASKTYDQGDKSLFVSVRGDSADEIKELWNKLIVGSSVIEDLGPAIFSPAYGMAKDRFGVVWVLDVAVAHDQA